MAGSNRPPPRPDVSAQTAITGRTWTYIVPAVTDPDGDPLTYSAVLGEAFNPLPEWLTFDADTRTFTGNPSEADEGDYEIWVFVSDDQTESSAFFTLTVEIDTNKPPVAVDDAATVDEGGVVTVAASTLIANDSDPENASLTITAVGGAVNGAVTLSSDKTAATYTHDGSETTTGSFTYTVSDGSASDTGTVAVTVSPVNDAPVAPSISDQRAAEAKSFTFQAPAFTDPEGDSLTYTAALSDGADLPAWLSFAAATRTFTGTPQEADTPATLHIRVTATDDGTPAASSSATFTLSVPETNNRPPAPQVSDQTATAGQTFTYTVPAVTDPDGDTLTYNAVQGEASNPLPEWLSFDAATRSFTGTPREADAGEYTIVVSVEDQEFTAASSFVLTVAVAANQAPVAPTLSAQTAAEDQAFRYQPPAFTDPDDDTLTYTAARSDGAALPAWLSFDAATRTFSGTPREADTPATLTIRVTATDDGTPSLSASADFTLTVTEANDAPVAVDDAATVAEGGSVDVALSTLLANDTDPEDAALSVTAVGGAVNGAVSLSADGATATYVHDGSETTAGSFTYTVSDGSATASGTVTLTVSPVNDAPVAPSISDQRAAEDAAFTYRAPAFTDPENDALTYTATLSDGTALPAWLSFDAATRNFSGTPREAATPVELTIRLTATDDGTPPASSSVTFTLFVPETNNRPPAPQVSHQTAFVDQSFTYTVPAVTDPDGDTLTYNAVLGPSSNPLPDWLSFDAATRTFSGTPRNAHVGEYTIVVSVEDREFTAESSFTLTVEVAAPPPLDPPVLTAQTATEDDAFSYTFSPVTAPGRDAVTYAATLEDGGPLPAWLAFNARTRAFTGTPREADTPATLTVRVTATAGGTPPSSSSATFTLTVVEVNDAPTADAGPNETVAAGDTVTLDGSRSADPERLPLSYTWSQTDPPYVDLSDAHAAAPTFTAPTGLTADAVLTFVLVVTDASDAASRPDVVQIVVQAEPAKTVPTASVRATANAVNEGDTVTFIVELKPVPASDVDVTLRISGAPAFGVADDELTLTVLANTPSARVTLSTVDDDQDEPNGTIRATVLDSDAYDPGASARASVTVWDDEPSPLVFPAPPPDRLPSFGSAVVADWVFAVGRDVGSVPLPSAVGGDPPLRYTVSPALPAGLSFDSSALAIVGAPAEPHESTRFTYTVRDRDGDSVSLAFYVLVETAPRKKPIAALGKDSDGVPVLVALSAGEVHISVPMGDSAVELVVKVDTRCVGTRVALPEELAVQGLSTIEFAVSAQTHLMQAPLPRGIQIARSQPMMDVTLRDERGGTIDALAGPMQVCLPVGQALIAEAGGQPLSLLHHDADDGWEALAGSWEEHTEDGASLVCALATQFSPFAVGYAVPPAPPATPTPQPTPTPTPVPTPSPTPTPRASPSPDATGADTAPAANTRTALPQPPPTPMPTATPDRASPPEPTPSPTAPPSLEPTPTPAPTPAPRPPPTVGRPLQPTVTPLPTPEVAVADAIGVGAPAAMVGLLALVAASGTIALLRSRD